MGLVTVPAGLPFRRTVYPVTPTLSPDAVQDTTIREVESGLAVRPVGAEGATASESSTTVTVNVDEVVSFPAKSRAVAVSACTPVAAVAVFQEMVWGCCVSSACRSFPSSSN